MIWYLILSMVISLLLVEKLQKSYIDNLLGLVKANERFIDLVKKSYGDHPTDWKGIGYMALYIEMFTLACFLTSP